MAACNKRPDPDHPAAALTNVACHYGENHDGPCAWDFEPSLARRGIDALLALFPWREIQAIDSQPERPLLATDVTTGEVSELTRFAAGPWVLVTFVGGSEFAIWKRTGTVYYVGHDGAVDEDPFIELKDDNAPHP
jgi:hypothetical protein